MHTHHPSSPQSCHGLQTQGLVPSPGTTPQSTVSSRCDARTANGGGVAWGICEACAIHVKPTARAHLDSMAQVTHTSSEGYLELLGSGLGAQGHLGFRGLDGRRLCAWGWDRVTTQPCGQQTRAQPAGGCTPLACKGAPRLVSDRVKRMM